MSAGARTGPSRHKQIGDDLWRRTEKINAELFTLTYGALIAQLIKDYEDYAVVNQQLEKLGYRIGCRIIEDILARSGGQRCADFREVAEVLSKVAFRSMLNVTPTLVFPNAAGPVNEFGLQFEENPLGAFVELPNDALPASRVEEDVLDAKELVSLTEDRIEPTPSGLLYANVLCGAIRGALEMVQYEVKVHFVSDELHGDAVTEIKVELVRVMDEELPPADD